MSSDNAVGYIRVSTHEQTKGWSLKTQEAEIRAYAQQHGLNLIEVYQDESSGGTDERPGFEKMIMDAYDGTFSTILFTESSRMFRNFILASIYKNLLRKKLGINLIFIKQPTKHLDEATTFLIESISDVFNEHQLKQLRIWIRAGKRARAMSGSWNGRIPFGYVANSKGEAVIDLHSKNGVILIFQKYSTGRFSLEEIASLLNNKGYRTLGLKGSRLFTEEAVGDILQNFFYVGFVRYKNDLFVGKHTPIIEPELLMKCQNVRAHRAKHARAYGENSTIFILAGIAHCNRCGQTLWGQALSIKEKEYRYYRHIHQAGVDICPLQKHGIKAEKLEAAWDAIISEITIPKTWLTRIKIYLSNSERFAQVMDVKSTDDLKEKRHRLNMLFRSKSIDNAEYIKFGKRLKLQEEALTISSNLNLLNDLDLAQHHLQTMAFPWNSTSDYHKQLLAKIMLLDVSIDLISETICKITPCDAFQVLFENTNLQSNNC